MQNLLKIKKNSESVGDILRFWRKIKRISQMDLALDVGISSKHLSFVETGRSQASRDLILRIAQELKIPFRHRNAF
jgi:transcriptional regulator with XRE-family HTH domain